jgi:hypothetical protein
VKILAFSDLHNDFEQGAKLVEMSAEADVVIGAGDFASMHEGLEETIDVLAGIETPTVLVPGNNETADALRSAAGGWSAATVLHGEGATISGIDFFGLGRHLDQLRALLEVAVQVAEGEDLHAAKPTRCGSPGQAGPAEVGSPKSSTSVSTLPPGIATRETTKATAITAAIP